LVIKRSLSAQPETEPRWRVRLPFPGSNPDLVVRNREGKVDFVLWEAVYAMMLNEVLKEHRKVEELEKGMEVLKARAAQIQKVSAQLATASPPRGGLEASKPAPKMVVKTP
jgi:hypothetical protein